jgi:hypothetical protein
VQGGSGAGVHRGTREPAARTEAAAAGLERAQAERQPAHGRREHARGRRGRRAAAARDSRRLQVSDSRRERCGLAGPGGVRAGERRRPGPERGGRADAERWRAARAGVGARAAAGMEWEALAVRALRIGRAQGPERRLRRVGWSGAARVA